MKSVDVEAGTIEYDEVGTGPAVVLLHGLLMNHRLWDTCLPLLPKGFNYIRPDLPLGAHRIPMKDSADLTLPGQVRIVAEFLDALDLEDVTLVHTDWGGALFLTAFELDQRVARQVVLPCEAFDNFPPGLPGRMASFAARIPGGAKLACRQLRVGWLRRTPLLYGQMVKRDVPADLIRDWTAPALADAGVRRDLVAYARTPMDKKQLIRDTEALERFKGDALVLWAPENKVMPSDHGRKLAALFPHATYAEVSDAYVLCMLDQPEVVAEKIGDFLTRTTPG